MELLAQSSYNNLLNNSKPLNLAFILSSWKWPLRRSSARNTNKDKFNKETNELARRGASEEDEENKVTEKRREER